MPDDGRTSRGRPPWVSPEHASRDESDVDFFLRFGEDTPVAADPDVLDGARRFRDVLGRFATGVTVVTSMTDSGPVGMTCQSFCSVSLAPPLVLFCAARTSRSWPLIRRAGFFCVNLLAVGQQAVSQRMATPGADKFRDLDWKPTSSTGAPLLEGVTGFVDCRVHAVHPAGDHEVVVGRVEDLGYGDQDDPLIFFRGGYTELGG